MKAAGAVLLIACAGSFLVGQGWVFLAAVALLLGWVGAVLLGPPGG